MKVAIKGLGRESGLPLAPVAVALLAVALVAVAAPVAANG